MEQLNASRLRQWHQGGEALLTFENLRSWMNATGLVLFSSRSKQLPAPAPTLVEAVLGAPNENPVAADTEQAKILLARLISEGLAVPLNLLGTPGETPDFVASSAVFSYIFTLRGDKAWKQPPATSGAVKVSPLALATYTLLTERVTMSVADLTHGLGKEVTESAVLRALNELWVNLRVLPIPQADGAATLWELTSGRFTKLMKAGANAGQPSALSALISLYLNTAIVASEEEIETFLSPLAARSRIRDVVHALMSARQVETIAVEGRTVLHVAGELPGFLAPEGSVLIDTEAADGIVEGAAAEGTETGEGAPRITKFVAKPRKVGTGFVVKPRPGFGARPAYGARASGGDRERKPFRGDAGEARDQGDRGGKPSFGRSGGAKPGFDKPSFTKPWQEGKAAGLAASGAASGGVEGGGSEATGGETPRTYTPRPRVERGGDRPGYAKRPAFGARPNFGGDRGDASPPRREFAPREGGEGAPRKTFSKPGTFGRKREGGFAGRPAFGGDGQSRPPRRDFGDARPPRREFAARPRADEGGEGRPARREFAPRAGAGRSSDRPGLGGARKPASFGSRASGSYSTRPQGGSGERKAFTPREGGGAGFAGKGFGGKGGVGGGKSFAAGGGSSSGGSTDRRARTDGPPFRKFDAPRGDRPARPAFGGDRPERSGGYAGKPSGGYAGKADGGSGGKKPFGKFAGKASAGKPGSGKLAGTFDKFKNNAKPFGNRPPARKYRPEEGESKG